MLHSTNLWTPEKPMNYYVLFTRYLKVKALSYKIRREFWVCIAGYRQS